MAYLNNKTTIFVAVSALAISAYPYDALAQTININCPQNLYIGNHVTCGNGTLAIRPDGSTSISGCLEVMTAPQPAQCQMSVTGGAPTRNIRVSFDPTPITIYRGSADTVTLSAFRLQKGTTPGFFAQLTYTPAEVTTTVDINFGATVSFSNPQTEGFYVGTIKLNANFL